MTRSRDWALVAALALVLAVTGSVWPEGRKDSPSPKESASKVAQEMTCKVYSLGSLAARAADPALGEWVAKTIPQVIEPGSWSSEGGAGKLSYYPQGKILVVSHEPAAQAKVRAFLDSLKTEMSRNKNPLPKQKPATVKPAVVPVRLSSPDQDPDLPAIDPAFAPQLINEPAKHYGHLLIEGVSVKENQLKLKKFSIVYRGEGLIDDTVAKLIKSLNKQGSPSKGSPGEITPGPSQPTFVPGLTPAPAADPVAPTDDEPTVRSKKLDSEKAENVPAPKKARRPAQRTSKSTGKPILVQSKYSPVPRLAAPDRPMVQIMVPDEAKHYAHLVVEGLAYTASGVKLDKLSIVYRGEGIIDTNVAKVIKVMQTYAPGWSIDAGLTLPSANYLSSPPTYVGPSSPTSKGTVPPAVPKK